MGNRGKSLNLTNLATHKDKAQVSRKSDNADHLQSRPRGKVSAASTTTILNQNSEATNRILRLEKGALDKHKYMKA